VHAVYVFDCMLSGVVCRLPTFKPILGMHLDFLFLSIMILLLHMIIFFCLLYEGMNCCCLLFYLYVFYKPLCYCLIILLVCLRQDKTAYYTNNKI
jgi:hypothetical protein